MATWKMKGLDEYIEKLEAISGDAEEQIKRAVYVGAGIVADEIKASLLTMPTHDADDFGTQKDPISGLTEEQKQDVINGFGITRFKKEDHLIYVKCGFAHASRTKTKRFPGGVPNATLMRSVESGSSFRVKTPLIRQAVNRSKSRALEAIKQEFETQINMIM